MWSERDSSLCTSWVGQVLKESPGSGKFEEDSDLETVPAGWVVGGRLNQGRMAPASPLVLRELLLQPLP